MVFRFTMRSTGSGSLGLVFVHRWCPSECGHKRRFARLAATNPARRLSSLVRGGKGSGGGAQGVSPSDREEGNGQPGEGFGAKAITDWPAGEAAEKGEGDQDAGSKP